MNPQDLICGPFHERCVRCDWPTDKKFMSCHICNMCWRTMEKTINYRDVLLSYMKHITQCEGITYLSDGNEQCFTPDEWHVLKQLEKELP